jgi:hypothetical protein
MQSLTCCQKTTLAMAVDCEGCLSLCYVGRKAQTYTCTVSVGISNSNLEFLEYLQDMVGYGTISPFGKVDGWKQVYNWRIGLDNQIMFLEAIEKNLIIKWEQCRILLEYLKRDWEDPLSHDDIRQKMYWVKKICEVKKFKKKIEKSISDFENPKIDFENLCEIATKYFGLKIPEF